MEKIVIGVDPHKLSATIEVVDHRETLLGSGRFSTDKAGYTAMCRYVAAWPQRTWAVEGSNGAGRSLAQGLLADGEHVVDVPAKLASRARMLDTGHGRKTDAHDTHSVAVAAVRAKQLRVLALDPELEALRMLADKDADGGHALPQAQDLRRHLPTTHRRRSSSQARGFIRRKWGGSGRALRGVSSIQRGRPSPAHRHFGSATSRTREGDATTRQATSEDHDQTTPQQSRLTREGSRKDAPTSRGV
jgi:Transposase